MKTEACSRELWLWSLESRPSQGGLKVRGVSLREPLKHFCVDEERNSKEVSADLVCEGWRRDGLPVPL
jgi:hypothetical protein